MMLKSSVTEEMIEELGMGLRGGQGISRKRLRNSTKM